MSLIPESVVDLATRTAIATVGIVGVENADIIVDQMSKSAANSGAAAGSPDWVEPLIQGIIAILSIIAAFFRKPSRSRNRNNPK